MGIGGSLSWLSGRATPSVTLDSSSNSINEGAISNYILRLSAGSISPVTVPFSMSGTAIAGTDYTIQASPIIIDAGALSKGIPLTAILDALTEVGETAIMTLGTPINAVLGAIVTCTTTFLDVSASGFSFSYSNFDDLSSFQLNGNASKNVNVLSLTPNQAIQKGSAFYLTPIPVSANTSFETSFQFQLLGGTGGADGFVFMLQNSSSGLTALGGHGGGMGYDSSNAGAPITTSLAVKFKSFEVDEIIVVRDGNSTVLTRTITGLPDLNSGAVLSAWIDYNGTTDLLSIFIATTNIKPVSPSLTHTIALNTVVGSQAYLGFSAGTGGSTNSHEILNWSFALV